MKSPAKRRLRGLSLAEIVVALGLVALVSLAVIGVFSSLLLSTAKTSTQAGAELLAKSLLDRAVRQGPPNWSTGNETIAHRLELGDKQAPTTVFYRIEVQALQKHSMGELHQVSVTVFWDQEGQSQGYRVGQGKTWVEQTRVVYIDEN